MQNSAFLAVIRFRNMVSSDRGRLSAISQNFREIVGNPFVSGNYIFGS